MYCLKYFSYLIIIKLFVTFIPFGTCNLMVKLEDYYLFLEVSFVPYNQVFMP
jgi:hypothetical protein